MGWFLSQKGGVKGFTNHRWNGITTLEWAKIALEVIEGKLLPTGPIIQIASAAAVSKYELLKLMGEVWRHNIAIEPVEAPEAVDRTLAADIMRSSIRNQLREQYDWYRHRQVNNG